VNLPVEWRVEPGLTPYDVAVAVMETRAAAIREGTARELIWLVEHPPVYTGGTSARPRDLLDPRFPVVATGRGGQYTYHGPGQRVVYLMLDLDRRGRDIRRFVAALERWVIAALRPLGIAGCTLPGRVGIWTGQPPAKIAAIGIRVRRWVTLHGVAINVTTDLAAFSGIVPCGIDDAEVTSIARGGVAVSLSALDAELRIALSAFLAELTLSDPALPA